MARVAFIGAGPGDPELMTLKGAHLIRSAGLVLFTGSLVPRELIAEHARGARVLDSKGMHLEQIVEHMRLAIAEGHDVARVHTGDPAIFGSIAEQMRRLDQLGIAWEIVPGVSSFTAAAAALGRELTLPEVSQTVIVTRAAGRTPMPAGETLRELAVHGSTLAIFLSVTLIEQVVEELRDAYGCNGAVAVVQRASLPDQRILRGTLSDIAAKVREAGMRDQAMILVGPTLDCASFPDSRLYAREFGHRYRRAQEDPGP